MAWALILWLAAVQPVALTVTPPVSLSPATVRYLLRVEPDDSNRWLCVGYTALRQVGMDRQSCWTLDGAMAPRLVQGSWPGVTAGSYRAWLVVERDGQPRGYASTVFAVLGS